MSVLANRQPTRKAKPVSGTCQWVLPIGEVGTGVLAINQVCYTITILKHKDRVTGYRLEKLDGTVYDLNIETEHWSCDCPDATFNPERPGGCKHSKALRAALKAAGKQ
jgi:hypothetical protein